MIWFNCVWIAYLKLLELVINYGKTIIKEVGIIFWNYSKLALSCSHTRNWLALESNHWLIRNMLLNRNQCTRKNLSNQICLAIKAEETVETIVSSLESFDKHEVVGCFYIMLGRCQCIRAFQCYREAYSRFCPGLHY